MSFNFKLLNAWLEQKLMGADYVLYVMGFGRVGYFTAFDLHTTDLRQGVFDRVDEVPV